METQVKKNEQELLKQLQENMKKQQEMLATMKAEQESILNSMSAEQKEKLVDNLEKISQELARVNEALGTIQAERKQELNQVKAKFAGKIENLKADRLLLKSQYKSIALASNIKANPANGNGKWKIQSNKDFSKLRIEYATSDKKFSTLINTVDLREKSKVKVLKEKMLRSEINGGWGLSQKTVTSQFTNNIIAFNGDIAIERYKNNCQVIASL